MFRWTYILLVVSVGGNVARGLMLVFFLYLFIIWLCLLGYQEF
jgi:hypothetical protein